MSSTQTSLKLQALITRLDNLIPYLSLSISAVGIAESGELMFQAMCRRIARKLATNSYQMAALCIVDVYTPLKSCPVMHRRDREKAFHMPFIGKNLFSTI